MQIVYEHLDKKLHNRKAFDCGEVTLNHYLSNQAFQNQEKGGSVTHVAVKYSANHAVVDNVATPLKIIYGYYTLVNNCIPFENFLLQLVKGMPKVYPIPTIPTTKIARLARNKLYTESGLGKYLF